MNEENLNNNPEVNPVNVNPTTVDNQGGFVEASVPATDSVQAEAPVQEVQPVQPALVQPNPMENVDAGNTSVVNSVPVTPVSEIPVNNAQSTMVAPTEVPVMQQAVATPVAPVQTPVVDNTVNVVAQDPNQQVMMNQPAAVPVNTMPQQQAVMPQQPVQSAPANSNGVIQPQELMNNQPLPQINNGGAMLAPMTTIASQQNNTSVKPKIDSKKIILLAVVILIASMVGFSIFGYKVVTCKGEEEVYNAKVTAEVKAYFWFGKINKMVTTKTLDLSKLSKDTKEEVVKLYKDREDNNTEHVVITDDKIVVTVTTKPANEEEAKIKEDDVVEAYEKYDFVCK